MQGVLDAVVNEAKHAAQLLRGLTPERQAQLFNPLVWLMKLGVLKLAEQANGAARSAPYSKE